jgi:hypothetical protein
MSGNVPTGPLTLSVTLPAAMSDETGAGSHPARLAAGGVLDRDGLAALIHLAHVGVRRGCRELVVDVHGLTDFPSALFAELRKLAEVAGRRRCRLRLDGLDTAVAAAVDVAGARDAAGNAEPGDEQPAAELDDV